MFRTNGGRYPITGVAMWAVVLVLAGCTTAVTGRESALVGIAASSSRTSAPPTDGDPTGGDPTGGDVTGADPTGSTPTSADPTGADQTGGDRTGQPDSHQRWLPSEENPDPSVDIPGIYAGPTGLYANRNHVQLPARVAYDRFPPVGGPHDSVWAACDGVVYDRPVRNENMVHSLEHGAVWIAYNPATISTDDLTHLRGLVAQVSYLVMTPYPDLPTAVSLQSWAHQLALDSATDPRLPEFLLALLRNPYLTPEPNATCAQPRFDVTDPPTFDPTPPGPDAVPMGFDPVADGTTTTG